MQFHFLHISDTHCGYDNYTVSNMREVLPKEINEFINDKGQILKYLFITGDLKYGKFNPKEYPDSTIEFIKNIQTKLNIDKKNTFIVPGNHDVLRGLVRSAAIKRIKETYSSNQGVIDGEALDALSQTTLEFKKVYYELCDRDYKGNIFFEELEEINVIHLNTALICGEDNEDGSLIVGTLMLKNALGNLNIKKPSIAIAHHSFDCLTIQEQTELERLLKSKNTILYLCGHKHVTLFSNISVVQKDKPLWQFLCGTNMDRDPNLDSTDMDVFVGMLNTESSSGYFDVYKWSPKSNHWIPDFDFSFTISQALDGRIYYPSKEINLSTEALNQYLQYLKISCSDIKLDGLPVDGYIGSKKIPLDLLYIPIKFKRRLLTVKEEIEAKLNELFGTTNDLDSLQNTLSNYNSPINTQTFNSVILAGPGHGKTTFLKKVINFYSGSINSDDFPNLDLFPLWIKCRSLNNRSDLSIMGIIKDLPSSAEFPLNNNDLEQAFFNAIYAKLLTGNVIILIDGLDEISAVAKRNYFIEQIDIFSQKYPKTRILITSRIVGYEDYNKSGLSAFEKFEIQPFDNEDIKELCLKWHKAVVNSLEETKNYAEELANIIINHDRIKALAVNPLLLTTLLLVQRRVGRLPTKRAALYEESIKVLLETWNQEGHEPIDIAMALCQLSYVAYVMTVSGIQQINKDNLISILYQAQNDLSRKLNYNSETPEQFIKRTEQRSSLIAKIGYIEDQAGILKEIYEFQHLTFQEYLTSFAIVNKYYPKAKRTDNIVSILTNQDGINAFRSRGKKDEIVLLTAALSGWDAEDIAIALINELNISNTLEYSNDLSRLAIQLILDEPELEIEKIKELLDVSISKITKNTLEYIDMLILTKYKNIALEVINNFFIKWLDNKAWLDSNPLFVILLIQYIEIDDNISDKLVEKLYESFNLNKEIYQQLSKSILLFISENKIKGNANLKKLTEFSLMTIDRDKSEIITTLNITPLYDTIINKLNQGTIEWAFDTTSVTESFLELIPYDLYFWKKLKDQMKSSYNKNEKKYNIISKFFLSVIGKIEIPNEVFRELLIISLKRVTIAKSKIIFKLLDTQYSDIIKELAEKEFEQWISGKSNITYTVYILTLLIDLNKKGVYELYESQKNKDTRSIIEAIYIIDVYYWLNSSEEKDSLYREYLKFLWNCLSNSEISVIHAALNALSFLLDQQLSQYESEKVIKALDKVISNRRPIYNNIFSLYSKMEFSNKLKELSSNKDIYKNLIIKILSNNISNTVKKNALISAILLELFNIEEVKNYLEKIEIDIQEKKDIEECIKKVYF